MDRRKGLSSNQRAMSMTALNFGHVANEETILRGQIGPLHFFGQGDSKLSLGQWSDHVDKYRDVAL